jgi:hypothetical protein
LVEILLLEYLNDLLEVVFGNISFLLGSEEFNLVLRRLIIDCLNLGLKLGDLLFLGGLLNFDVLEFLLVFLYLMGSVHEFTRGSRASG